MAVHCVARSVISLATMESDRFVSVINAHKCQYDMKNANSTFEEYWSRSTFQLPLVFALIQCTPVIIIVG
jgi:hypothetical protein